MHRLFLKRIDEINSLVLNDEFFPKTIQRCFWKSGLNAEYTADRIVEAMENVKSNTAKWADVAWLLICIGYVLGRKSEKKSKQIKRYPRL